ncbi:hypothetical protein [Antarctobacter jejuensis]|uniref:hypothetical protein n=1 Tax=Antarctobacter jejuensis TaxID=1439938 RepID=UPI003FCFF123
MRLFIVLLLTGFFALLSLPGSAMAHGSMDGSAVSTHMADCPECSDTAAVAQESWANGHICPHLTGCAAMVLPASILPQLAAGTLSMRHGLPIPDVLSGTDSPIDLPPPRLRP